MPPRKSNPRKSDTSTARFAPMDDATPAESSPAPTPTPTPAAAATPAPAAATPTPAAAAEAADTSASPTADRKDKDKDKDKDNKDAVTIEDLTLPKSIITRLAKGVLPPNTQIQANAILALSQSTTVFINYLASHANENTVSAGKKTIAPADVFKALEDTEFSFLRGPLEAEFAKFNAIQTEKRTSYRQKVRAKKTDGPDTDMPDTSHVDTDDVDPDTTLASEASGPRTKRARVDPANAGAAADVEEDAETEDDEPVPEDDDDDDDEVEEEEEEEEEEEDEGEPSGDETQDALEIKEGKEERDEALDGDDSD